MTQLETRLSKLEARLDDDGGPFEFGVDYFIVRDADTDFGVDYMERHEFGFHPPQLKSLEYVASAKPNMMTHKMLEALLAAIDGKTRTVAGGKLFPK